jgi:endonuclease/exonuclease/phosphatase family metal-dependent hydrolase
VGSRLRILSANLMGGNANPQAFAEVVRTLGVDIAAVQELSAEQAEALREILPFGTLRPSRDYNGMGIALRRPARDTRLELSHRNAPIAELDPSEWTEITAPVEVVNVHITAPHMMPTWRTVARRRAQLRGLLAYLDATPSRRQLIVGDFNATPLWPVYRRIARRRLDAVRIDTERRGQRAAPTWGPGSSAPRLLRIDHAFIQGLQVERSQVIPIKGSDHSAVMIEVSFPWES